MSDDGDRASEDGGIVAGITVVGDQVCRFAVVQVGEAEEAAGRGGGGGERLGGGQANIGQQRNLARHSSDHVGTVMTVTPRAIAVGSR